MIGRERTYPSLQTLIAQPINYNHDASNHTQLASRKESHGLLLGSSSMVESVVLSSKRILNRSISP